MMILHCTNRLNAPIFKTSERHGGEPNNSGTEDDIDETDQLLRQLAEIPRNMRRAEQAFRTRVERHRHVTKRYPIRCTARPVRNSRIRSGLLLLPKSRFDVTGVHPPPEHQSPKMTLTGSSSPGERYFFVRCPEQSRTSRDIIPLTHLSSIHSAPAAEAFVALKSAGHGTETNGISPYLARVC